MTDPLWEAVDRYAEGLLLPAWPELDAAVDEAAAAGIPAIQVSPLQARLLALIVRMTGARRVLEVGTLFGFSAAWLASALPPDGVVVTLEIDPDRAEFARRTADRAGVGDRVDVRVGPAAETLAQLPREEPFDVVFIDADKPSNPAYVEAAVALSHPGTVIVVDNVVRRGAVADADSDDPAVRGSRAVLELLGSHPQLDATMLQTVGAKGHDGFAFAVVR